MKGMEAVFTCSDIHRNRTERGQSIAPFFRRFLPWDGEIAAGHAQLDTLAVSQCMIGQEVDLPDPGQFLYKAHDPVKMFRGVIDAGDDRAAEYDDST